MISFMASLILVTVAELGDKTQLLVLSFAAKHKPIRVIFGIGLAIVLLQFLAALLGREISDLIPMEYLRLIIGIMFIGFGIWALKGEEDEEDSKKINAKSAFVIVLTIASAFFVAELGDKTQLATFSLAAKYNSFFQVWIGSAFGMLIADTLAITAGIYLGKKIPHEKIKFFSAALFILFGLASLAQFLIN